VASCQRLSANVFKIHQRITSLECQTYSTGQYLLHVSAKPRLHQGNMLPGRATCIRIHICWRTHVAGYMLLVWDTFWLYLDCIGNIITIHLCHGRFVSLCIQQQTGYKLATLPIKKHVDGNRTHVADNLLPGNMLPWCKRGFKFHCWIHRHSKRHYSLIIEKQCLQFW